MSYKEEIERAFYEAVEFGKAKNEFHVTEFDLNNYLSKMTSNIQCITEKMGLGWGTYIQAYGVAYHMFELECSGGDYFRNMKVIW